ncbi:hypothetical protein F5144DRAFT_22685 [Chaetomium tenue]|uniref:Uncharacterized protein n=1 Tax=Chaetomium tenue TaxID=1854479 RepID=A0ACB7PKN5_9PEZI|nr:hypothetical protein F5144DRAFT_22685 [Chaetomium globosum]
MRAVRIGIFPKTSKSSLRGLWGGASSCSFITVLPNLVKPPSLWPLSIFEEVDLRRVGGFHRSSVRSSGRSCCWWTVGGWGLSMINRPLLTSALPCPALLCIALPCLPPASNWACSWFRFVPAARGCLSDACACKNRVWLARVTAVANRGDRCNVFKVCLLRVPVGSFGCGPLLVGRRGESRLREGCSWPKYARLGYHTFPNLRRKRTG